jgi:hypothetical protein
MQYNQYYEFKGTSLVITFLIYVYVLCNYTGTFTSPYPILTNVSVVQGFIDSFFHINIIHLIMNCLSLWNFKFVETKFGTYNYLLLLIAINIICTVIEQVLSKFYNIQRGVGFSGILFAINVISGNDIFEIIKGLLKMQIVSYLLSQNVSFIGHVVGVLAGIIVNFALYNLSNFTW